MDNASFRFYFRGMKAVDPARKIKKLHVEELIQKVSDAVRMKDVPRIVHKIKEDMEDLILQGAIEIPPKYIQSRSQCYARRLLHRDPELGFVMVVMTWGPGQGTPIHDHAGIWCVEGVIQGKMAVTSFEVEEQKGDLYRFREAGTVTAGVGGAGSLIPPHEHHILTNVDQQSSVTLHVYGREFNECSAFVDQKNGWHKREMKELSYHG